MSQRKPTKKPAEDAEDAEDAEPIPPAPELDPQAGDKTPAYVEWLREYHPEEYVARFSARKHHLN
jgi:hypothetical protein